MNRIDQKFKELKNNNKKALITYVTAGDPNMEVTISAVEEMERTGADIIELGVPFSDPVAEGPVIQRANERAMKNNYKLKDIMSMVVKIRKKVTVPMVFLIYFNCIFNYRPEKFFKDCSESGIDAVIIPDLPYEELGEIKDTADKYNVYIITLVSPISQNRINKIVKDAKGFIYCVSSLGVTGMRNKFETDFKKFITHINEISNVPKAIGFGISNTEHIKKLKKYSDGLIVGSAIVKCIEDNMSNDNIIKNLGEYVSKLRKAID